MCFGLEVYLIFTKAWRDRFLLHIICGYQCDKAVTNILYVDISVIKPWLKMIPVKWYDIISPQWNDIISLHGLNCPIKYTVIIWLDQSGCTLYFSWRLASNLSGRIGGKNLAGSINSYIIIKCNFLVLQLGGLIFFKHVIYNKQIITC